MALAVQIYLLRETMVLHLGDEMAAGIGLCTWLLGISLGAAGIRMVPRSWSFRAAPVALILLALSGTLGVVVARFGRSLLGVPAGELLPLGPSLLLALMVFLLPGACVGAGFVTLAAATHRSGGGADRAIARLYVIEALGALLAGLLLTLVLLPRASTLAGLTGVLAVALLAATPAARARAIAGRSTIPAVALLALGILPTPLLGWAERATEQARFESLAPGASQVIFWNTPYQHLSLAGSNPYLWYSNGRYTGTLPDPTADEVRAHELMVLAERPNRVLVLGAAAPTLVRYLVQHPCGSLELLQLDRAAFLHLRAYLGPLDRAALDDPRVTVIFDDPRHRLRQIRTRYDLILHLDPDPTTLLLARETSVEFDRLIRRHLTPRGVYVTGLPTGANLQTGLTGTLGAELYRTLRQVFPAVLAAPGPEGLLVAGNDSDFLTLDPSRLGQRYRDRKISSGLFTSELFSELFPTERVATLNLQLARAASGMTPGTDDRPLTFLHALVRQQNIAQSAWSSILKYLSNRPYLVASSLLLPSLLILLIRLGSRSRATSRLAVLNALTVSGAAGLALSLVLWVSFQTRVGALYSWLGALTGLFMAGLAAGGAWASRPERPVSLRSAQAMALGISCLLALVFSGFGGLLALGWLTGPLHGTLMVAIGFGTGAVLPAAARKLLDEPAASDPRHLTKVASSAELCDHLGAAAAALVSATILIPVLGLTVSVLLLGALQGLALAATLPDQSRGTSP